MLIYMHLWADYLYGVQEVASSTVIGSIVRRLLLIRLLRIR
jgi:hypothetical protein